MTRKKDTKYHSPLVGRDKELAKLKEQLNESMKGAKKLVLIEGEPGIGKTRLILELYPHAQQAGFEIFHVNCSPQKMNDPYGVFIDIIDKKMSTQRLPKEELPIIEFFESGKPSDEREQKVDLQRHQSRMFELISQFLNKAAKDKPMCILIDDVHNADVQSLRLLHYVVRSLKDSQIFICGAYRTEELEAEGLHPLRELIQRMSRERVVDVILLERLSHEEGVQMITNMFPNHQFSDSFLRKVYDESEGNPLFIIELLKTMVEEDAIYQKSGKWHVVEKYELLEIPATIRDIISRRILRLSSDSIDALRWASVIGEHFSFELLKNVLDINEERMLNVMDELLNDRLIVEDAQSDSYRFAHMKIREVAYDAFTRGKEEMHYKVANTLEKMMPLKTMNGVYDLVYHYSFTKDYDKLVKYCMLAGKKAMSSYALKEALTYYTKAKNALTNFNLNEGIMRKKMEIIINLADINVGLGEMDEALKFYNEVVEMGKELGDEPRIIESHMKISGVYLRRGEFDIAANNLRNGLELAETANDYHGLVWVYSNLGVIKERRGEYAEAIAIYNKALKYAQIINNDSDIGLAYTRLGGVYRTQLEFDTAAKYVKRGIKIWEKINDFRIPYAYVELAAIYLQLGKIDDAIFYYDKCAQFSKKTGDIYLKGVSLSGLTEAYMEKGDFEKSLEYLTEAQEIFERLEIKDMISSVYKKLGIIFRIRKIWDKSKEYFEKSIDMFERLDLPLYLGEAHYEYALLFKDVGDLKGCKLQLNKALELFKKLRNDTWIKRTEIELDLISKPD